MLFKILFGMNYLVEKLNIQCFSSPSTDSEHERQVILQNAVPEIQTHCQQFGLEFQVIFITIVGNKYKYLSGYFSVRPLE